MDNASTLHHGQDHLNGQLHQIWQFCYQKLPKTPRHIPAIESIYKKQRKMTTLYSSAHEDSRPH